MLTLCICDFKGMISDYTGRNLSGPLCPHPQNQIPCDTTYTELQWERSKYTTFSSVYDVVLLQWLPQKMNVHDVEVIDEAS